MDYSTVEQHSLHQFDDVMEMENNSDYEDTGDLESGGYNEKNYHWTPSLIRKRGYNSLQQVGTKVSPLVCDRLTADSPRWAPGGAAGLPALRPALPRGAGQPGLQAQLCPPLRQPLQPPGRGGDPPGSGAQRDGGQCRV